MRRVGHRSIESFSLPKKRREKQQQQRTPQTFYFASINESEFFCATSSIFEGKMTARDVTALLARYLTAPPEERAALQSSFPDVFCEEVLLEMQDAELLMQETDSSVLDVHSCFKQVVGELDLPGLPAPLVPDHVSVPHRALFAHNFNQQLASLMAAAWRGQQMVLPASGGKAKKWYEASGPIETVFSFMPIMDLLCVSENTCRAWRAFLQSEGASAFWIGCVQREFPTELGVLVAAEGSKLFESDWRTIAMLVCSGDEGE